MKKFIDSIANVWKIEELKNRIILTLGLLLVYRFGAQVTLPGIDASKLTNLTDQTEGGIGWLINVFTGGAFSQASVFALGIMPYISASIVVQLMGIAIPYLQKLQSDGESGRKKINQITRWLTIAITLVQGPGYIYNLYSILPPDAFLLGASSFSFLFSSVLILVTGTIFAMWLGEKITDKGIGRYYSTYATIIYSRGFFKNIFRVKWRCLNDCFRTYYLVLSNYCLCVISYGCSQNTGSVRSSYRFR